MLECHFKVAELKMHLRSLVLGVVSRRVGWEVVLGKRKRKTEGVCEQWWWEEEACVFSVE